MSTFDSAFDRIKNAASSAGLDTGGQVADPFERIASAAASAVPGAAPGGAAGEQDIQRIAAQEYENQLILPELPVAARVATFGIQPREIERGMRQQAAQAAQAIATPGLRAKFFESVLDPFLLLTAPAARPIAPYMAQAASAALEPSGSGLGLGDLRTEQIAARGAAEGLAAGQQQGVAGDVGRAIGQTVPQFLGVAGAIATGGAGLPVVAANIASQATLPLSSWTGGSLAYFDEMDAKRAQEALEGKELSSYNIYEMQRRATASAVIQTGTEVIGAGVAGKAIGTIGSKLVGSQVGRSAIGALSERGAPLVQRALASKTGQAGAEAFARVSQGTMRIRNGFFGDASRLILTSAAEEGAEELGAAILEAPFTEAPLSKDLTDGIYSAFIGSIAGGAGGGVALGGAVAGRGLKNRRDAFRPENDAEIRLRQLHSDAMKARTNWTEDLDDAQQAEVGVALNSVNGMNQEERGIFLRELSDRRASIRAKVESLLSLRQDLDAALAASKQAQATYEAGASERAAKEALVSESQAALDRANADYQAARDALAEMELSAEQARPARVARRGRTVVTIDDRKQAVADAQRLVSDAQAALDSATQNAVEAEGLEVAPGQRIDPSQATADIEQQIDDLDAEMRLLVNDNMIASATYNAVSEKVSDMPMEYGQSDPSDILSQVSGASGVQLVETKAPKRGGRVQKEMEALGIRVVWFKPSGGKFGSPAFHSMSSRGVIYMNADADMSQVRSKSYHEMFHDIQMFRPEIAQAYSERVGLAPIYEAGATYAQGRAESAAKGRADAFARIQAAAAAAGIEGVDVEVPSTVSRIGASRLEQEGQAEAFGATAARVGGRGILSPLVKFAARQGLMGRDVAGAMAVIDAVARAAAVEKAAGVKPVATLSPLARTLLWMEDMSIDIPAEIEQAVAPAAPAPTTAPFEPAATAAPVPAAGVSMARASDADYLAAVERGDMETAQKMVDAAARAAGYVIKAFHGSASKPFWVFDPARRGERTGSNSALLGFFASTEQQVAREYQLTESERRQFNEPTNLGGLSLGGGLRGAEDALDRAQSIETSAIRDDEQGGWLAQLTAIDQFGSQYSYDDGFVYDTAVEAENAAETEKDNEISKAQKRVDDALARFQNEEQELRAGRTLHDLWVRLDNPLVYDFEGGTFRDKSYSELVQEAIDGGHDGVIMQNTRDAIDSDTVSDVIVFFKSNQAKLADPVTRDESGNVIPLSKRFDTTTPLISYARASDADYLAAVERGDMATAQRMVDEAAKEAGYTLRRYHITPATFTTFRTPSEFTDEFGRDALVEEYKGENVMNVFVRLGTTQKLTGKLMALSDNKPALTQWMDENNLDSVTVSSNWGTADDIIIRNPQDIKSADPVTYDESGNVIPLSQRFDVSTPLISYAREADEITSLREQVAALQKQIRDVQNVTAAQRVNALREVRVLERRIVTAERIAEQKTLQATRAKMRVELEKQAAAEDVAAADNRIAKLQTRLDSAKASVQSLKQELASLRRGDKLEERLAEAEEAAQQAIDLSYAIGRRDGLLAGQIQGQRQERRQVRKLSERLAQVEQRLDVAVPALRDARKQIRTDAAAAQRAINFAYGMGLAKGRIQGVMEGRRQVLLRMARREDTLQNQLFNLRRISAERLQRVEDVADAVRTIATDAAQMLPVALRGPLAVRIANAKTLPQANRIAVEAVKLAADAEVKKSLDAVRALRKSLKKRGMTYAVRTQVEALLDQAEAGLKTTSGRRLRAAVAPVPGAPRGAAPALVNAVDIFAAVVDSAAKVEQASLMYAMDRQNYLQMRAARIARYDALRKDIITNMSGRPTLAETERADRSATIPFYRSIGRANSDIYTMMLELEGTEAGVLNDLLSSAQAGKGEAALEHATILRQIVPALQSAGYESIDDYALKNGMLGDASTNLRTVVLGGQDVTLPVGTILSLAAMDDETLDLFGTQAGQGVTFAGATSTKTFFPTRQEIESIRANLSAEERGMIDAMKSILETQIRDRVMDAVYAVEGDQPPVVANYWPRVRQAAQKSDASILNATAGNLVRGALTTVGFAQARTGGNQPLVYRDAFQTWERHVQVALDMIHMAQPYRDAATVLTDPAVVRGMDMQFGEGTAERVLSVFSNGVGATARSNPTIIDKLTNNVTGAVLALRPRTLAKVVIGGQLRLASEIPLGYWSKGVARAATRLRSPSAWDARVEEIHSINGYFSRRHQLHMRSIISGSLSDADRVRVTTAWQSMVDSFRAAGQNLAAAQLTDAVGRFKDASNGANMMIASVVDMLRYMDEQIMLAAVEARLAEVEDEGALTGQDALREASLRAERDFRRTQNASDEFDDSLLSAYNRVKGASGWRIFFPFSSDPVKARNQIRRAYLSGNRRLETAGAIGANMAASTIIGAASIVTVGYMVSLISSMFGGDEPDEEEKKAFNDAVSSLPVSIANEIMSSTLGYLGIALGWVTSAVQYNRSPFTPIAVRPIEQVVREAKSAKPVPERVIAGLLAFSQYAGFPMYGLYQFVRDFFPKPERVRESTAREATPVSPREKLLDRIERRRREIERLRQGGAAVR